MANVGHERIVRVGVCEHGADGQQHLGDGECGRPVLLENIQTDGSVGVDVGVVDSGSEGHLWWLEGVVSGEVDRQKENTSGVRRV